MRRLIWSQQLNPDIKLFNLINVQIAEKYEMSFMLNTKYFCWNFI